MKKPEPLSARSRLLPVAVMFPWPNCCATAATCTPLPTAVCATPSWVWAKRSANSARDCLKPVVLTLARLFEVTLRSVLAALMPERARSNDMGASSIHLDDVAEGERPGAGIQGKGLGARIDGHAVDRALQIRGERGLAAAGHGGRGEGVCAGGRCSAGTGGAVPREIRETRRLRRDLEGLHEVATRIAHLDRDAGGAGGSLHRTAHRPPRGEAGGRCRCEHVAGDQAGAAEELRGLHAA